MENLLTINPIKETAVISGANGFIGKHLCKRLSKSGIRAIDIPRELLSGTQELTIFLDRCQPDYIFHLAAYGNHSSQIDAEEIVKANYLSTLNLLTASQHLPYKAFVHVSTSSVLLPYQTMYSATKFGAEKLCQAFYDEYEKPIVSARPYSIYGVGEAEFRFIPTVFRSILQGTPFDLSPGAVHDWLYVDSFVDGIINTATKHISRMKGKSWNFGTGTGTSNKQIVRLIENITKKKAKITINHAMRRYDNKNWICELNNDTYLWNNEYIPSIEEGLRKIYSEAYAE